MIVLAFDSGLERTGYAVFDKQEGSQELMTYGCITTSKKLDLVKRIHQIAHETRKLIDTYSPDIIIIERLFFNLNKKTVISVAQAQGAMLSIAGEKSIDVEFITPLEVKQTITGYGNSDKKSVQKMVTLLLELEKVPEPDDIADAIACGLTYCTIRKLEDMHET